MTASVYDVLRLQTEAEQKMAAARTRFEMGREAVNSDDPYGFDAGSCDLAWFDAPRMEPKSPSQING